VSNQTILRKYEVELKGAANIVLETEGPAYRVFRKSHSMWKELTIPAPYPLDKVRLMNQWAQDCVNRVREYGIKPFWVAGDKPEVPAEALESKKCSCEKRLVLDHGCKCGGI